MMSWLATTPVARLFLLLLLVGAAWNRHFLLDVCLLGVEYPVHNSGSIIVSGASSGIGRAACGHLAKKYPKIIFFCGIRKPEAASGVPFDLPNVHAVKLDVTKASDVESVLDKIEEPLIGVVSNAAIGELGTIEFQLEQTIESIYEVNVLGTLRLTRAALPRLRESQGRVVWMSSCSALFPSTPRWGVYQSSKAALESLAGALRMEVKPANVSVSTVLPGFLKTEMTKRLGKQSQAVFSAVPEHVTADERETYPWVYNEQSLQFMNRLVNHGGKIFETVEAIDHALFSKHPRSRYWTSRIALFPSWLFKWFAADLMPTDHVHDWFLDHEGIQQLLINLMGLQEKVEQLWERNFGDARVSLAEL